MDLLTAPSNFSFQSYSSVSRQKHKAFVRRTREQSCPQKFKHIKKLSLNVLNLQGAVFLVSNYRRLEQLSITSPINYLILARLSKLNYLYKLQVVMTKFPNETLLRKLKKIQNLSIQYHRLSSTQISLVANNMPKIRSFGKISAMDNLRDLDTLSSLKKLNEISFVKYKRKETIQPELLEGIVQRFPHIRKLIFESCNLVDFHLVVIAQGCPSLETLKVPGNKITSQGLRHSTILGKKLKELNLVSNSINQSSIEVICSHFKKLQSLQSTIPISDVELVHMSNSLPNLTNIKFMAHSLRNTTGQGMKMFLISKPNLKSIDFSYTSFVSRQIIKLLHDNHQQLQSIKMNVGRGQDLRSIYTYLSKMEALTYIHLVLNYMDDQILKLGRNRKNVRVQYSWHVRQRGRAERNMLIFNPATLGGLRFRK